MEKGFIKIKIYFLRERSEAKARRWRAIYKVWIATPHFIRLAMTDKITTDEVLTSPALEFVK